MALTNGDFETGDLTGWTSSDTGSSGTHTTSCVVGTAVKRKGTYGVALYAEASGSSTAIMTMEQTITLSEFSNIDLWFRARTAVIPDLPSVVTNIQMTYHDSGEVEQTINMIHMDLEIGIPPYGWRKFVINKQAFLDAVGVEGGHVHTTTKFRVQLSLISTTSGVKSIYLDVDDIAFDVAAAGELTNGNFASGLTGWFDCSATDCTSPPSDASATSSAGTGDAVLEGEGNFYDYAVASIAQEMTTSFSSVSFEWQLEDTAMDSWCYMLVQFLVFTDLGHPRWANVYFESIAPSTPATLTITKGEVEVVMGYDSLLWGTSTAIRLSLYLRPVS